MQSRKQLLKKVTHCTRTELNPSKIDNSRDDFEEVMSIGEFFWNC